MREKITCPKCDRQLTEDRFHYNDTRPNGLNGVCKECEYGNYLKRTYGISFKEYKIMENNQNNRCYICEEHETYRTRKGNTKRLCVDHDHETGKIRALLCNNCNRAIGHAKENIKILKKMIEYINKFEER